MPQDQHTVLANSILLQIITEGIREFGASVKKKVHSDPSKMFIFIFQDN